MADVEETIAQIYRIRLLDWSDLDHDSAEAREARTFNAAITTIQNLLQGATQRVFIELNFLQANNLTTAYVFDMNRIRHERERWWSQADRDMRHRDESIERAIELGVPREQAHKFVFGKKREN